MLNNGYDLALAEQAIAGGKADLDAFGRSVSTTPILSNACTMERCWPG
ncbi:hypothetical protein [Cupriavidus necator]|uniref:Uncharacterized protein n=1 Tax=Cupriavidus basilensis TaxID=68895 RepID=A0A7M2HBI2_9BURK|nr:hypothetical protein [Cupriavidus necator]QOT81562.1 hypothetical protein F7R26_036645 [Cupriavidus basilensis]BDB30245.1 hypothetical protein CTP10_R76620 [Cupriavidus sp. P-10]